MVDAKFLAACKPGVRIVNVDSIGQTDPTDRIVSMLKTRPRRSGAKVHDGKVHQMLCQHLQARRSSMRPLTAPFLAGAVPGTALPCTALHCCRGAAGL